MGTAECPGLVGPRVSLATLVSADLAATQECLVTVDRSVPQGIQASAVSQGPLVIVAPLERLDSPVTPVYQVPQDSVVTPVPQDSVVTQGPLASPVTQV